jgi:hypothetical protein
MKMQHWWNDVWQEKIKVLGKKPGSVSVHHESHVDCHGLNPCLYDEKLVTNHLRYGMA